MGKQVSPTVVGDNLAEQIREAHGLTGDLRREIAELEKLKEAAAKAILNIPEALQRHIQSIVVDDIAKVVEEAMSRRPKDAETGRVTPSASVLMACANLAITISEHGLPAGMVYAYDKECRYFATRVADDITMDVQFKSRNQWPAQCQEEFQRSREERRRKARARRGGRQA